MFTEKEEKQKNSKKEKQKKWLNALANEEIEHGDEKIKIKEIVDHIEKDLTKKRENNEKSFQKANVRLRELAEETMKRNFTDKEVEDFRAQLLLNLILKKYLELLCEVKKELQVCDGKIKSTKVREFCSFRIELEEKYGNYSEEGIAYPIRYTDENEKILYSFVVEAENHVFRECIYRWEKCVASYKIPKDKEQFYGKNSLLIRDVTSKEIDSNMKCAMQEILLKLFGSYKDILKSRLDGQIKIMDKMLENHCMNEKETLHDELQECIESALKPLNKEIETTIKDVSEVMVEFLFEFLKKEIFSQEEIWKYYYLKEIDIKYSLRQRKFEQLFQECIQNGEFECGLEYKHYNLPKKMGEDIISYNNKLNEFSDIWEILCEEFLKESYKPVLIRNMRVSQYSTHENLNTCITGIFGIQNAVVLDQTCSSLWKEIFYIIINDHTLPKKKRKGLVKDEGNGYIVKDVDGRKERVWGLGKNISDSLVGDGLKKNFSAALLMRISSNVNYANLIDKGHCKDKKIKSLVDNSLNLQRGLDAFEQYIVELQTGIISTWKLYECTSDLIYCEEYGMFQPIIKKLASAIGHIHNLEMRCWVIDQVSFIMNRLSREYECGMYSELLLLVNTIENFAKKFNEKYDLLFKVLLYMYWDKEYFVSWQKDVTEEVYTKLLGQVEKLSKAQQHFQDIRGGINANPIMKNKFADLYHTDSKTDRYKWYHIIWAEINQRQEWILGSREVKML